MCVHVFELNDFHLHDWIKSVLYVAYIFTIEEIKILKRIWGTERPSKLKEWHNKFYAYWNENMYKKTIEEKKNTKKDVAFLCTPLLVYIRSTAMLPFYSSQISFNMSFCYCHILCLILFYDKITWFVRWKIDKKSTKIEKLKPKKNIWEINMHS